MYPKPCGYTLQCVGSKTYHLQRQSQTTRTRHARTDGRIRADAVPGKLYSGVFAARVLKS